MDRSQIAISPDIAYGARNGVQVSFDVYEPGDANGAAVLFINSGGFVSGQLVQYAETGQSEYRFLEPSELTTQGAPPPIPLLAQFSFGGLLREGFTVFDVRHGNHPPTMLDEMVEDVHAAGRFILDHAADYRVDPTQVGIWGASAGGYLALHLGLSLGDVPFRAIATYYPAGFDFVQDVERFPDLAKALPMLDLDTQKLDTLSLKHQVRRDAPPVLIVYGTDDMPFVTDPCQSLCAALEGSEGGVRCVAIPGTGHEFRGESGYHEEHGARAQAEMVDWFVKHLSN
jgi:acetyl esterase/lipase